MAFENTESESRRLTGTRGWVRSEIVIDVPPEGEKILFGTFLSGNGCVWIDSFTFEVVSDDVPLTKETEQAPPDSTGEPELHAGPQLKVPSL